MQKSSVNIKEIRNTTIAGIACQFIPLYLSSLIAPRLQNIPGSEAIASLVYILSLILALFGYGLCWVAADKYATYKGYRNPFYIYSILNIVGLSFLFLLNNKNQSLNSDKDPIENFSLSAILISWFAIPSLFTLPFMLIALYIAGVEGFEEYYLENSNLSQISSVFIEITFVWYVFREFNRTSLNYKAFLGSLEKINFKLPIGLAVVKFLFVWSFSNITLYSLSFILPKYVEQQINKVYATSFFGWIAVAIGALLFAPVMEEIIYRGILFQKLTITQNFRKAIAVSALFFAIMHFRYDVISLFVGGVLYVLLYLRTKQLIIPIISHFFYNLIVTIINLYDWLSSRPNPPAQMTIAEYQQHFSDRIELYILLLAISIPYLFYFIYKNYPRNYNVQQLPYFANQRILDRQNG